MGNTHTHDDGRQCHEEPDGRWRYTQRHPTSGRLHDHVCERPHYAPKRFSHADGRRCMEMDGRWMHWDHEPPEPGPREWRSYLCNREHNDPVNGLDEREEFSERGEFGMPHIGAGARAFAQEMKGYEYSDMTTGKVLECGDDQSLQAMLLGVYENAIVLHHPMGLDAIRVDAVTDEARYILSILPDVLAKFLRKNAQYARAQTGHDLGLKGIIPDINRKSAALITAVWDGGTIEGGDTDEAREIAEDLIGHLLLMLAKMRDMPEWNLAPGRLLPKDA